VLIDLNTEVRAIAIQLRQKQKIKLPDAIVAATSLYLQLPLVTADQGFKGIKGIELILIS
jgi:predicted nucleic acid-binding protein